MKTITFILLSIVPFSIFAEIDTLRHYDVTTAQKGYAFSSTTYPSQYAIFTPPAPGFIKSIIVTLGGNSDSGSVTIHLYGHEGGTPFPQLQNDLITPIIISKTTKGIQQIEAELPDPVWIDNNLFSIKITDFSSGVTLIRDGIYHSPFCSSNSGGDYYLQYIGNFQGTYYYNNAFAIDVVMDYTEGLTSPRYFQDVTAAVGIDTNLSNSCVSWADINKDGYLDLFVDGTLYRNNGNSTFSDITTSAGINTPDYVTTFLDMNNDGKVDILFLHPNTTYNVIYINNGDETFTKTPFTLSTPKFKAMQSFSIADFNNDKYPDLFIGQVFGSDSLGNEVWYPNYLYLNDKNLGFTDTSLLIYPSNFYHLPTRGSQWVDYNDDGQIDLYVANYRIQPDELWENNGDGTFTNVICSKNIDYNNPNDCLSPNASGHGTGVDWADYDNDGDMDLLLPSLAHPRYIPQYNHRATTIYQNTGSPNYNFVDLQGQTGIQYEETHAGATWGDLNNDGLLDLAICAFYGCRYSDVYLQTPDHSFELKSFAFGISNVTAPSDVVLVDYDNDGKLDLACGDNSMEKGVKFKLFKNTGPFYNNYTAIDLVSTSGNAKGIGAKVVVYAGSNVYTQYQMPYHGALMSKGDRIHFGLGDASTIDSVVVHWTNGTTNAEKFTGVAINTYNILTEGGTVEVGAEEKFAIKHTLQVSPNPASQSINFSYELSHPTSVTLTLYSLLGQSFTILNNQQQREGQQSLQWQLKDEQGNKLPAGIYTYQLQTEEWIQTGKVILQ